MKTPALEEKALREIVSVFAGIANVRDMQRFFEEIFTPSERRDLALRWQLLRRLSEGIPQRQIADEFGISLCKITRGSRILKNPASISARILKNTDLEQKE